MHLAVGSGDAIRHVIAGSGGHGPPWRRDPERVAEDVRDEKVSIDAAAREYGVVIDPERLRVDIVATTALRAESVAK